jgi:hypothetical protein
LNSASWSFSSAVYIVNLVCAKLVAVAKTATNASKLTNRATFFMTYSFLLPFRIS